MPPSLSEFSASSEIDYLRQRVNELERHVWKHQSRLMMAEFKISTMAAALLIASFSVALIALITSIAQAD